MRRNLGRNWREWRELCRLLVLVSPGQRRVAQALLDCEGQTYSAVAAQLGVHIGTVNQHLRRMRQGRPEVYHALMKERGRQLAVRHRAAVARAREHTRRWLEIKRLYPERFEFPGF
jgi:transposase